MKDLLNENKGFTLIELVIVMAIVAILAVLVKPTFGKSTFDLKTQSMTLCYAIRDVRLRNMTESNSYHIVLEENQYRVLKGTQQIRKTILPTGYILEDNCPDDDSSSTEIRFSNNGAPSASGTIKFKDINRGIHMEIRIVPSSGRVLLRDEIFTK
ncbi:MAG: pilus assembly FimT family protein [Bacillota bacterium]